MNLDELRDLVDNRQQRGYCPDHNETTTIACTTHRCHLCHNTFKNVIHGTRCPDCPGVATCVIEEEPCQ
ncbi:hypothetical protein [Haloarchaeobius sp. DFWS5]|uniref:hypothetical protein n=1 Tax=Haloarchaeobius sp. DFWS5 TaxID=3446114 RepID=UPI003EBEB053